MTKRKEHQNSMEMQNHRVIEERLNKVVSIAFSDKDIAKLDDMAWAARLTRSTLIRQLVREGLDKRENQ